MPTYYAQVSYTGDGNTTQYSITFSFIDSTHVKAFIDGTETTAFTISSSTLTFTSAPANGAVIRIERQTPVNSRLVDFTDGSVLTESDLDKSADQNFYIAQEITDDSQSKLGLNALDRYDANNKRIINVANPVDNQDAVTKYYLENTWLDTTTKANINTLGAISDLGTLASNNANVTIVANNIASVNQVATDIAKVITVANDLNEATAEIDTVANSIANVDAVGTDIANVNTVASNITSVNNFGEKYKISATAPTGVTEGTLWFDTSTDTMKVYNGSSFANAGSSVNGSSQRNKFTATASQTVFTGTDDDGVTLAYDPNFLDVYLNGVRLVNGASNDFTATDGSTITLTAGASAGDILNVVSFGTFQIASFSATAITSDTLATARLPVVPITKGGTGLSNLGSSGQALVVNSGGTGLEYANASSAEVYGFERYYSPSTLNIAVTVQNVSGSNVYFIDGVQQDTLNLLEGNTYVFSYPSAHPFALSTTANGTHGGGSEYTTGVTRDTGANTLTFVVPSNAPQLYYYCTAHSNMGGTANTPVPANNSLRYITTNQGQDNITSSQYANFDDVLFSASGFTFSLSNGELIATI